ncbi:hypothetical protein DSM43276_02076 [Mycobacteroides salmoniphilum]|uniref:Uncharacterized protein n=1 Tax=Mycobacteroides salmoniphilum TaxID=404941 RepID=A0A4V3I0F5_9MYCO|nr:hypothetical protein DSM43276_02076 [Mycobacteroides salmoniphilum]TDZ90497.1 hypothetical protein CCUG62472_03749 [Mycobacteroides salmoniphilum]TEA00446.1 hypothetical protein CCUG60884_04337 [Mycobacteroides salmoniphilum]
MDQRGPRQQGPRKHGPSRPAQDSGARRDDRGGGAARPRRSDERGGDRPQRNQAPRPRRTDDRQAPRNFGPTIPDEVEAKQLAHDVRAELLSLDKNTADTVARHLVVAGNLLDEDPEAALEHAKAAKSRAARIAGVREALGIAAYHCGDWALALSELRAAKRMGTRSPLLALIADCERGVGRPERAIELARGDEAKALTGDAADELRIVIAGARADMGQLDQALAVLSTPAPDPKRAGVVAARLFYAYADILLALDRKPEAVQWFLHAANADVEGHTDAEDRAAELA